MAGLPLNAIRAFATVYSAGGIRAAARALAVTHSSISRHVAELETWLGVALIGDAASRRALVFTPQGEAFGKAAVASLAELERVAASLREVRSEGTVTIATSPSIAVRWLLPRLAALEAAHRTLEISVIVDQRVQDLEAVGADVAIRSGAGTWADVDSRPLMMDALYPVISPAYHAKLGRPDRPAALARMRLLHDRDPQAGWDAWRAVFGPASLDVRRGPRLASSDLVLRAAMLGQGVALARHQLVRDDVAAGVLVRPFGELAVDLGMVYWLVLPTHAHPRPATQTVVRWLEQQAAALS
jgi:LysR family glycine cleavage system transcriptional activator